MDKINIEDQNYPVLLKEITKPPQELYFEGELKKKEKCALAVVGTRKISDYGRRVTEYFVKVLAQSGVTIVSGLALGVDGLAHKTTLREKGRTIAVLGSGLNQIYPRIHQNLAQNIVKNQGAVVSEYDPEMNPSKITFPARNRIIAGLSLGTLIIEAPEKSGALITAQETIKEGRKLFVVPARIYDRNSKGSNILLRKGAEAVIEPKEVLRVLGLKEQVLKKEQEKELSSEQSRLLEFLRENSVSIDFLIEKTDWPAQKIAGLLIEMELKGLVKDLGSGKYVAV
ncbi:DNA-processing protein DprA [Patescibacteria group bacterium]|nr:DNA-processing protein DprA [Patescibacteria group bacterium]